MGIFDELERLKQELGDLVVPESVRLHLELIEIHRLVTERRLLAAVPRRQAPRHTSCGWYAVERGERVRIATGVDDGAVAVESGSIDEEPVLASRHPGGLPSLRPLRARSHATSCRAKRRRRS